MKFINAPKKGSIRFFAGLFVAHGSWAYAVFPSVYAVPSVSVASRTRTTYVPETYTEFIWLLSDVRFASITVSSMCTIFNILFHFS